LQVKEIVLSPTSQEFDLFSVKEGYGEYYVQSSQFCLLFLSNKLFSFPHTHKVLLRRKMKMKNYKFKSNHGTVNCLQRNFISCIANQVKSKFRR
jgi:hypothetical protein